jgi:hypothetical protein
MSAKSAGPKEPVLGQLDLPHTLPLPADAVTERLIPVDGSGSVDLTGP